jgi:hypothetical protein
MKKIILLPKTDTVILCLPEQWAGTPIICKLIPMTDRNINFDEMEFEVEKMIEFRNKKRSIKKI